MTKKVARVLSIDGGGIRGVIPAVLLESWEARLGRSLADSFHLIAGTSTGGILACGLCKPGHALSGKELLGFYEHWGPSIFRCSAWHSLTSLGGSADEKYPAEPLEEALKSALSGRLSEVERADLLVTAYEIERRDPFLFKSWKARGLGLKDAETSNEYDFHLVDVARATSAAPTYFEPAKISNAKQQSWALVDGGVFANNPAMCAYAAARQLYPNADEYLVVSLGTGELERKIAYEDARNWGLLAWARPILNVIFDGVSDTVGYQLEQLAPQVRHLRFQITLGEDARDPAAANDDLDDASPDNLARLKRAAAKLLSSHARHSNTLLEALAEPITARAELGYPRQP